MRMKRAIIIPVLFLQIAAFAQDLNPTVTVINEYEGEASGIVKPAQVLNIPDSVSRFTLNFDYSVFESPYMGSYEFKPYSVQIRPRKDNNRDGLLYVKAGAGYTLHPDLHVVYTPFAKPEFALSVFANHESYIGNYWNFKADGTDPVELVKDPDNRTAQAGRVGGSDLGARLRYSWGSGELNTVAAWDNLFSSIDRGGNTGRLANLFDFETSLKSIESPLDYDATLKVRAGADKYRYAVNPAGINATEINFTGSLGTLKAGLNNLSIGTDVALQFLGGDADAYSGYFALIPRDEFWLGGWHFNVGLRVSALLSGDETVGAIYGEPAAHQTMFTRGGQWIYPHVLITKGFAGDKFFFDAGLTGGERYGSYWDFVAEHPFLGAQNVAGAYLDNTIEKLNVFAGIRGSVTGHLELKLKGGYRMVDNELMWKAVDGGAGVPDMLPHLGWCSYNQAYSALDVEWLRDPFSAKIGVEAAYSWLREDGSFFAPSILKGTSEFKYHWGDRIRTGIRGDWQTSRKAVLAGNEVKIPGYCDLGVFGEFQWRKDIAFWLEGGNLLNMTIMSDPFIAQRGVSVTGGVIFRL